MKILLSITSIIFFSFSVSAQIKTKPVKLQKIKKEIKKQKKSQSMGFLSREEARCNVVWKNYKILLKHILHKDENETLDIGTVMNNVRVKFNPIAPPEVYFRNVLDTEPFPVLGNHFVQQPNGVYPVAVEMVSYLQPANGNNSVLGFAYEEGNYNDVIEVMDVFKTGTQVYIKIKRNNGVIQDIKYYPRHFSDGCEITNN